jgi:hypothetical protein
MLPTSVSLFFVFDENTADSEKLIENKIHSRFQSKLTQNRKVQVWSEIDQKWIKFASEMKLDQKRL